MDLKERVKKDPVYFPHLFSEPKDIEIAAFIAAQFSYGNIVQIMAFLKELFSRIGTRPKEFIISGEFSKLKGLYYRFHKEREIELFFFTLRNILSIYGSIEELFSHVYKGDTTKAIFSLRERIGIPAGELKFFFPLESKTNPLKRWNLFLRWMVRKDGIDFGIWNLLRPRDLLVPLDTHIFKVAKCLGWIQKNKKDLEAAKEITAKLRLISPEDPLKYDFFICHFIGIENKCPGIKRDLCKGRCIFYG